MYQERPKIRKVCDCTNAVKTACVNLSVECNMSAEISRVDVHTVCKNLYVHNYFWSKDEAIERDPSLSENKQDNPPTNKRKKLDLPKNQVPKSLNEYRPDKNVFPSAKTINDYKLTLAERKKVEKVRKLVCCIEDKEKCVIHIRALKQSLNHGLRLKEVHRVIQFNQKAWLKPYIDKNTDLRKEAKNEFEKDFFKLMNDSVFGKTMENIRNHRDIKLVASAK